MEPIDITLFSTLSAIMSWVSLVIYQLINNVSPSLENSIIVIVAGSAIPGSIGVILDILGIIEIKENNLYLIILTGSIVLIMISFSAIKRAFQSKG